MSYVVVTTVAYPPQLEVQVISAGRAILSVAQTMSGIVSVTLHQSTEHNHTMMYWEWEAASDHEACMQSAEMTRVMAEFGQTFSMDGLEFLQQSYQKIG